MSATPKNNETAPAPPDASGPWFSRHRRLVIAGVLVVLAAAAGIAYLVEARARASSVPVAATFRVRKGNLRITLTEGGSLQAERLERIRSQVPGSVSIIYLIPEGTIITDEDVKNGKVLVELDGSSLKERCTRQEITVANVTADLTKATEDYQIQRKQSESDIRAAELNAKFAQMELEYYLGKEIGSQIDGKTEFSKIAENPKLGGTALQRKIDDETDMRLTEEEVQRANDRLEWTKRLFEKKYVTRNEMMADELALKRQEALHLRSEYALQLFLQYELPKEAESRFADWREKKLTLERVRARAASAEAQAAARLKSSEATATLERQQLEKLGQDASRCTIRATKPGLVVYASSTDFWQRANNPIQEGVFVRERQEIIHMPDLNSIIAQLKVHESRVRQIQRGQKAVITVDALPDLRLEGEIKDVAGLPDPQNWMQDVKVFTTTIALRNISAGLKPGMSCRAEITIDTIPDTHYVPVQAVVARGSHKVCYVVKGRSQEIREVETGLFDDKFVDIRKGLQVGELVLMNPPFVPAEEDSEQRAAEETEGPAAPATPKEQRPSAPAASEAPRAAEASRPAEAAGTPAAAAESAPRGDFMKKMTEAGITAEDFKRWRTSGFTEEDTKKLKAAGLTDEEVEGMKTRIKSGQGERRTRPAEKPAE